LVKVLLQTPSVGTIFLCLALCSIFKKESELITCFGWQQLGIFGIFEIKWFLNVLFWMLLLFWMILNLFRGGGLVDVLLVILVFRFRIGAKILWVLFLTLSFLSFFL
jgi:hypothetical protein